MDVGRTIHESAALSTTHLFQFQSLGQPTGICALLVLYWPRTNCGLTGGTPLMYTRSLVTDAITLLSRLRFLPRSRSLHFWILIFSLWEFYLMSPETPAGCCLAFRYKMKKVDVSVIVFLLVSPISWLRSKYFLLTISFAPSWKMHLSKIVDVTYFFYSCILPYHISTWKAVRVMTRNLHIEIDILGALVTIYASSLAHPLSKRKYQDSPQNQVCFYHLVCWYGIADPATLHHMHRYRSFIILI